MNDLFEKRNQLARKLASMTTDDVLKMRVGYAGKSQQWQYGFDLACREKQAEIEALKTQNAELLAALGWYGEHSRLARLITSEGDAGRNAIASDGGQKAREAIAKARGDLT